MPTFRQYKTKTKVKGFGEKVIEFEKKNNRVRLTAKQQKVFYDIHMDTPLSDDLMEDFKWTS